MVAFGNVQSGYDALGMIAPRPGVLSFIILMSLIATGLYQFHQRAYFFEIIVRIIVGIAVGSAVLAAIYYVLPSVTLEPRIAAMAVLIALVFLLIVRFIFICRVDENIFRHRTLVYGAGERASAISETFPTPTAA